MLAADGLLVQLPNRGAQVVALSREDVPARLRGDGLARGPVRRAGRGAGHRRRYRGAARRCRTRWSSRHARHDLPTYYRVNRAIHDRINAIAGNPILTHTFRTLNARLHALRFRSNLVQAKWDHAVAEHREMIEALAARDGDRLRDLLVGHLRTKLQAVLETMDDQ